MTGKVPTVSGKLRTWVTTRLESLDEVDVPTLTEEALDFLQQDQTVLQAFVREQLHNTVHALALDVIRKQRGPGEVIDLQDKILTRESVRRGAIKVRSRWTLHFEFVGGTMKRLTAMTKADLKIAAETRRAKAAPELIYATLWERLGSVLEADQTVGDVFDEEAIDVIHRGIVAPEKRGRKAS